MIDFLFVVDDPQQWHAANLQRNPGHYSGLRYLGSRAVTAVQNRIGAGVYYNTMVTVRDRVRAAPGPSCLVIRACVRSFVCSCACVWTCPEPVSVRCRSKSGYGRLIGWLTARTEYQVRRDFERDGPGRSGELAYALRGRSPAEAGTSATREWPCLLSVGQTERNV